VDVKLHAEMRRFIDAHWPSDPRLGCVNHRTALGSANDMLAGVGDGDVVEQIAARLADEGVLLESARGPVPNVAELVAGEPIRGSWWAHPQSHRIFATINALADRPDVARMRLVRGRVTLVHRRLWAPLLRLEARLPSEALLVVLEEHTPSGAHRVTSVPLASWVDVRREATDLDEQAALARLPAVVRDQLS
jgi:hypothetical protein